MTLKPGTQLGPYEIISAIGAGGMGEVYRARDTRLGRTVAIKILDKAHMERFEREARAIAALNHPHICTLHDIGPDYLVMEYIEGEPVKGPLPAEEAIRIAIQIAGALEEAHRRRILHRDLKPGNIMVTASGSAKLLDFGLAKQVSSSEADTTSTLEGAVMGTPAYMSPEQAQGKPVDVRSDIFSFGAVLYEMLSGRRAFDGPSTAQVISAVLRDDPKPVQTLPQLERVVMSCLAKQPQDRYQTMSEVKKALEQVSIKPAEEQPSIAVLPFANMSGDKEQEYFSDGLAEEIINTLTKIPGLKVIARTSAFAFRGKEQDIRRIAEALGVTNVLEGSVRKSGKRIRVTAQLITAVDGSHLWSERYDREIADVFAIQDEIASAITAALRVKLSVSSKETRLHTPNLPAYEAYLKAKHYWAQFTPDSFERCRQWVELAIRLDPELAEAHVQLGDYFLARTGVGTLPAREGMPMVHAHARKALDIDPLLPDAHAMLGIVAGVYDHNWKEAGLHFQMALARDSVPPKTLYWYGFYHLLPMGRYREAVDEHERALKEDPLNLVCRSQLGICLLYAGRQEEAVTELHKALELDGNFPTALAFLALVHTVRGMTAEALMFAERAYSLRSSFAPGIGLLAGLLARTGDLRRAEEVLKKLGDGQAHQTAIGFVNFHLVCGQTDKAADWAEKAIEQRHPLIFLHLRNPLWQSSSEWQALMNSLNLPEASVP
jgi:eukaryotic-like serine/threonine-protein kinase